LDKLDLQSAPDIPRAAPDDEEAPELPRADFAVPPSESETRAATLYMLERGLILALPPETLEQQKIDPAKLMLRVTANGVDAFENFALANYQRATEQPIGFSPTQAARVTGMPLAEKGKV
jgi:hypothetical protein